MNPSENEVLVDSTSTYPRGLSHSWHYALPGLEYRIPAARPGMSRAKKRARKAQRLARRIQRRKK